MKINFNMDDFSSDTGLLLAKGFACNLNFDKVLKSEFKTKNPAMFRIHKNNENFWQMVWQSFGTCFEDSCADELTNEPVLATILGKKPLLLKQRCPDFSIG